MIKYVWFWQPITPKCVTRIHLYAMTFHQNWILNTIFRTELLSYFSFGLVTLRCRIFLMYKSNGSLLKRRNGDSIVVGSSSVCKGPALSLYLLGLTISWQNKIKNISIWDLSKVFHKFLLKMFTTKLFRYTCITFHCNTFFKSW